MGRSTTLWTREHAPLLLPPSRGESRANPDTKGQFLPDPDAAWAAAWRIARQLLEWNLEPVQWLDYHVQVTDEAGEIVCELPISQGIVTFE